MFSVLVTILRLDSIAIHRRLSRKRKIALVIPMSIAGRSILPLAMRRVGTAGRRPSLRPCLPASGSLHSIDLP
jgi:hypothetical protein